MDLRQFRYFVAVAEELHFTRAAERLNIGQPPLSLQIQAIERELGVILLKRTRRNVELTPVGELFLKEARLALLQAERAVQTVTRAAKGEMGTLRLSFITSVPLVKIFTSAVRAFRSALPDVHLELKCRSSVKIIDDVLLGKVDVGFTRPSTATLLPTSITAIPVYSDRLMAVLPVDHPLNAKSGPLRMEELREENFVLRPRGSGTGFYEQVFDLCAEAGYSPRVVQIAIEATTTLGLVAAGVGVTVAPEALQAINVHDVVWRELDADNLESRIYLIYNKNNGNPILERFTCGFTPIEAG
ncbi:LysR substrate-binding domain-containing protein [Faunimonas sp. B44]|uniref:LysR substrate-binding domain-containing protein n=1 Tax=Faunimonas sp. B44 TaxID=3461493 RepID=UPI0040445553